MKPAASGGAINTDDGGGICAERRFQRGFTTDEHRYTRMIEAGSALSADLGRTFTAEADRRRTVAENAEMGTDEH